jgi:DNA-binding transcriptional LysR family regulator
MQDPRRLLTFRAVAHHGSFSRAAEAMSLSQPAVSQQVAALERELGTRLLERGRGGVVPTETGARLLEHADALADRLELAGSQLAELADRQRRELRVGAFPSALAAIVPTALGRLRAGDEALELSAQEARGDDLPAGVRAGRFHVAVAFQDTAIPARQPSGTTRHELGTESMVLAMSPRHRLARRRRPVRLEELTDETWTAPSRDGLIRRACLRAGFEPRIAFDTGDPLAIRALVADGLAVTLTSQLLAPRLEDVVIRDLPGDPPRRSLYALTPDHGTRPVDRQLIADLVVAAAEHGARPAG